MRCFDDRVRPRLIAHSNLDQRSFYFNFRFISVFVCASYSSLFSADRLIAVTLPANTSNLISSRFVLSIMRFAIRFSCVTDKRVRSRFALFKFIFNSLFPPLLSRPLSPSAVNAFLALLTSRAIGSLGKLSMRRSLHVDRSIPIVVLRRDDGQQCDALPLPAQPHLITSQLNSDPATH